MRASSINNISSLILILILILVNWNASVSKGQNTPPPANQTTTTESEAPPPANQTATTTTTTTRGRTLRIAVPVSTYTEFVSITNDPITQEQRIGGFSVEVFQAVVNTALSDRFEYKLYPFAKADGTFNGSFDDMLKAVSNQVRTLTLNQNSTS